MKFTFKAVNGMFKSLTIRSKAMISKSPLALPGSFSVDPLTPISGLGVMFVFCCLLFHSKITDHRLERHRFSNFETTLSMCFCSCYCSRCYDPRSFSEGNPNL